MHAKARDDDSGGGDEARQTVCDAAEGGGDAAAALDERERGDHSGQTAPVHSTLCVSVLRRYGVAKTLPTLRHSTAWSGLRPALSSSAATPATCGVA